MTERNVQRQRDARKSRNETHTHKIKDDPAADLGVMFARGRLSDAKKVFAHRRWGVIPSGIRGRRIVQWGADHAWLAASANPKRSVRNWCRKWAPWLKDAELDLIVAETETRNKHWSHDQSAAVLEIGVTDREELKTWFLGADDDQDHEQRRAIHKAKNAARQRRYRAAHTTGRKVGRPGLVLSPEDKLSRRRAQGAERARKFRASRKNTSRDIDSLNTTESVDTETDSVTEFSVTLAPDPTPGPESRERPSDRRLAPTTGYLEIVDEHGQIIRLPDDDWIDPDPDDDPELAAFAAAAAATKSPMKGEHHDQRD
jgi:hypothetical protein